MPNFESPFGKVELTNERLHHIFKFHPDVRSYQKLFAKAIANPSVIRRSKFDPAVKICYHPANGGKYLAVVIKTNQRNFVLTIYLTSKIQHQPL